MKGREREGAGAWAKGARSDARLSPTTHLSTGSLVLWPGLSKKSPHMDRLRNAKIYVERAVKVRKD